MKQLDVLYIAILLIFCGCGIPEETATQMERDQEMDGEYFLIIRADDFGMTQSANSALVELIETGMPLSASVMTPTPWFLQAADILNDNPDVSVGIHLVLNSEWENYRWGPVLGKEAVPSLVDEFGYFFPSASELYRNNPDPDHLEMELRAQIERALQAGLNVDYVDFHMGTAVGTPEFREVTERVAAEFGLGMSGYFGENFDSPQYSAAPGTKTDSLLMMLDRLEPGYNTVVVHVGLDTPEMAALRDMNTSNPLSNMSAHRQGELNAVTSYRFMESVNALDVQLINYRDVITREGLESMSRPEE